VKLRQQMGTEKFDLTRYVTASELLEKMMTSPEFTEFLTLVAYDHID
jgi:hypothetical protein